MAAVLWIPLLIFAGLYGYFRERIGKGALTFKALATAMAVLIGLQGAVENQSMHPSGESTEIILYGWLIAAGLVLCMAADVFLEIRFRTGMLVFGAGHLCFIGAYVCRCTPTLLTAVIFLLLYAGVFCLFRKDIPGLGELKNAAFIYMALLGAMVSLAATAAWETNALWSRCILAGGLCFLVSDVMIARRTVKKIRQLKYDAVLLLLYYGAVYLIACSVIAE